VPGGIGEADLKADRRASATSTQGSRYPHMKNHTQWGIRLHRSWRFFRSAGSHCLWTTGERIEAVGSRDADSAKGRCEYERAYRAGGAGMIMWFVISRVSLTAR